MSFLYPESGTKPIYNILDTVDVTWQGASQNSTPCALSLWVWFYDSNPWTESISEFVPCSGSAPVSMNQYSKKYYGQFNFNYTNTDGVAVKFLSTFFSVNDDTSVSAVTWVGTATPSSIPPASSSTSSTSSTSTSTPPPSTTQSSQAQTSQAQTSQESSAIPSSGTSTIPPTTLSTMTPLSTSSLANSVSLTSSVASTQASTTSSVHTSTISSASSVTTSTSLSSLSSLSSFSTSNSITSSSSSTPSGSSATSTSSSEAATSSGTVHKDQISTGAAVGITLGAVAGVAILGALIWLYIRKWKAKRQEQKDYDDIREFHAAPGWMPSIHEAPGTTDKRELP